jgi:hypothetical protein
MTLPFSRHQQYKGCKDEIQIIKEKVKEWSQKEKNNKQTMKKNEAH